MNPDQGAEGLAPRTPAIDRYERQLSHPKDADALILNLVPDGCRLLDVGCGTGCLSHLLQNDRGAFVTGIEPHTGRAAIARERGINVVGDEFTGDTLSKLAPFDVILFADVLEHFADPQKVLIAAKLGLNPTGFVLASIPNVAHWSVRWDLLWGRFDYQES